MIVKPLISWLTTDSDALLANDTGVVLKAMADNVSIYEKPAPELPVIQTALDNFSAGVVASRDGGPSARVIKNNLRLVLVNLMRQLASYVSVACKGDMANLILSGFPPHKPVSQPIGPLATPKGLTVKHGAHRSEIDAKVNPVFGAAIYNWRCTPATPGAAPIVEQDTASRHTFASLTAGVNYTIEVSASGTAGQSDWSSPASLVAD